MIDVGQGDSFLIKFPDGETALIDAGNVTPRFDNGLRVVMPLMNKLGINQIDYGFVSHIDVDHYGGFIELINNNMILKIFKPLSIEKDEKDLRFEKFLSDRNVPVEYYLCRSIIIGNAEIFILNDKRMYNSDKPVTSNSTSGVLKILYGNTSFLFTGDLEKAGERYYANKYDTFLNVDVLKPGHHGSKTSSSEKFIKTVSPEISLISCGTGNRYGHPSGEVITRLVRNNSKIYRTDLDGGVLLQSDGLKITRVDWRNYY
jgi:competence protein ComEC